MPRIPEIKIGPIHLPGDINAGPIAQKKVPASPKVRDANRPPVERPAQSPGQPTSSNDHRSWIERLFDAIARFLHLSGHSHESVSNLFPPDTRFPNQDLIWQVPFPQGTTTGAVEESAHVLNYTTPKGKYCELWWKGGDSGLPLLAYLVDRNDVSGFHYLPTLSQPNADGQPKFTSNQDARDKFIVLAKQFYGE